MDSRGVAAADHHHDDDDHDGEEEDDPQHLEPERGAYGAGTVTGAL